MPHKNTLLKQIPPFLFIADLFGTVLFMVGLYAYLTPGVIGEVALKPYAGWFIVGGVLLMLPLVKAVIRVAQQQKGAQKPRQ